jgi:hypothetical protein
MNVVFGVYSGYNGLKTEKGGIYYFAKSLRKYNQDCQVVVLCEKNKVFKELEDFCNEHDLQIYSDFSFEYELMLSRFKVYYELLSSWSNESIDRVLLCDLDDIVFQGDPFSIEFDEQLYCAAEKNIISDTGNPSSGLNRHWIGQATDVVAYSSSSFENQPVLCAGTILGTYAGVLDFLRLYTSVLHKKPNDQGLYNVYVYNHTDLSFRKVLPYGESQILTLDGFTFEELRIQDGRVINNFGQPYAIIHQINRCNAEFMKNLAE